MMKENILKVVIVRQLVASHDTVVASKESHTRLSRYGPLLHLAVRLARVIDEPSTRSAGGGVDDHVLVERHEVKILSNTISRARARARRVE